MWHYRQYNAIIGFCQVFLPRAPRKELERIGKESDWAGGEMSPWIRADLRGFSRKEKEEIYHEQMEIFFSRGRGERGERRRTQRIELEKFARNLSGWGERRVRGFARI